MLSIRLLATLVLALGLLAAPGADAAVQLYQGSWIADSFGNDKVGGTGESQYFSVFAMPQGVLCNPGQPICPFVSTPTDGKGAFHPTGQRIANYPSPPNCAPITIFGTSMRPAKGATPTSKGLPLSTTPRYRNPAFFSGGSPLTTSCTAYTTISGMNATAPLTPVTHSKRGVVMKGAPLIGLGYLSTTAPGSGNAFTFAAAPATSNPASATGFRRTTLGEFNNIYPYVYSYTYATLRNSAGFFSGGGGFFTNSAAPATISVPYVYKGVTAANVVVKRGANSFGGVMRLLGQLTTKVCYFRNGGCSLGGHNWKYDYIGTSAYVGTGTMASTKGVVTKPYIVKYLQKYYHTNLMQTSTVSLVGERFPWTTGTVTLTALGRGPHKTTHVRKGFDNRTATSGKGTIQLVSPILTHWLQPCCKFETGGVAVMRIAFFPEPQKWMLLVAGLSLLGVLYRARAR